MSTPFQLRRPLACDPGSALRGVNTAWYRLPFFASDGFLYDLASPTVDGLGPADRHPGMSIRGESRSKVGRTRYAIGSTYAGLSSSQPTASPATTTKVHRTLTTEPRPWGCAARRLTAALLPDGCGAILEMKGARGPRQRDDAEVECRGPQDAHTSWGPLDSRCRFVIKRLFRDR